MLTKDLVRFQTKGKALHPEFIDPGDETLLGFARQLVAVFKGSVGRQRFELEDELRDVLTGAPCAGVIAKGLEKLLLDRVDFDPEANESLAELRERVFLEVSQRLSQGTVKHLSQLHREVAEALGEDPARLKEKLYGDLPEFLPVKKFRLISAERLLHRYNAGLVQWLLLNARELVVRIHHGDAAHWRQLLKHLRFQQLLAEIQKKPKGWYEIRIDGPLNLFAQTRRYGMSLANFFPALLDQAQWELKADIQIGRRAPKRLRLSHEDGLRPFSRRFLAYVPEEIRMFQELFEKKAGTWRVSPAEDFLPFSGDAYGIPDYELRHESGVRVALELFHPWHAGPLAARLEQLSHQTEPKLVLGVARSLAREEGAAARLEASPYFQRYGFMFRDMPTVDQVLKVLKRIVPEPDEK